MDDDYTFDDKDTSWEDDAALPAEPVDPVDPHEAFNAARRMFAITLQGDFLLAPRGSKMGHREWLSFLGLADYEIQEAVRGHVFDGQVYLYDADHEPLSKDQYTRSRAYMPVIAMLNTDADGWVHSGLRKADIGHQWEPKVKIGQIRPIVVHALKYPEG